MAIALVVQTSAGSSDSNTFTTSNIDTTGATLLVVSIVSAATVSAPTLSDNKSNTWTALTTRTTPGPTVRTIMYYAENPTVGSGHNFTVTGDGKFASINVSAWSGTATASVFDTENGNNGAETGTSIQPGSVTPANNDSLVVTSLSLGVSATPTINGSFTITSSVDVVGGQHYGCSFAYLIQTTAAAANPTWDWSPAGGPNCAEIAVFKVASQTDTLWSQSSM